MMNTMKYKGYQALITYWDDDRMFNGRVLCAGDVIGFEGETIQELEEMFHSALEDYFDLCKNNGKEPAEPLTGEFETTISPEQLAQELYKKRKSIEASEADSLLRACGHDPGVNHDDSRERFWACWKNLKKANVREKDDLKQAV